MADLLSRYATEATEAQLVLCCNRMPIKAWRVDAFIPVFLRCQEIVKRAENIVETSRVETAQPIATIADPGALTSIS